MLQTLSALFGTLQAKGETANLNHTHELFIKNATQKHLACFFFRLMGVGEGERGASPSFDVTLPQGKWLYQ